jgi:hypothetical protein
MRTRDTRKLSTGTLATVLLLGQLIGDFPCHRNRAHDFSSPSQTYPCQGTGRELDTAVTDGLLHVQVIGRPGLLGISRCPGLPDQALMLGQHSGVEVPGQMADTAPAVAVRTLHGNRLTGALVPQAKTRDKPPHPETGPGLHSLRSFTLSMMRIAA